MKRRSFLGTMLGAVGLASVVKAEEKPKEDAIELMQEVADLCNRGYQVRVILECRCDEWVGSAPDLPHGAFVLCSDGLCIVRERGGWATIYKTIESSKSLLGFADQMNEVMPVHKFLSAHPTLTYSCGNGITKLQLRYGSMPFGKWGQGHHQNAQDSV